VKVGITLLVFKLFLHVFLVEADYTFLKLFEVSNAGETFKDIVLKLLPVRLLLIKGCP